MKKRTLEFKKRLAPDIKGTLLQMEKGDEMMISTRDAKTQSIRVVASRMKDRLFEISEKDLVNETRVTRIR